MKQTKNLTILAALALCCASALATPGNNGGGNGGCGVGQQTNGCGSSTATGGAGGTGVGLGLGLGIAGATAGAAAGANSIATGGSATGGNSQATTGASNSTSSAQGGAGGSSTGHAGDVNVRGDSGHTFVAPAPAATGAPMASGGIVTKSHAVGLGWNLLSWSKTEQAMDPFVGGMRLVAEYERLCQYETASMLRQRLYALLDPSYRELPAQPGVVNLTSQQCSVR